MLNINVDWRTLIAGTTGTLILYLDGINSHAHSFSVRIQQYIRKTCVQNDYVRHCLNTSA
jgi:hypothetical protein